MNRNEIVKKIGEEFWVYNTESEEFSYTRDKLVRLKTKDIPTALINGKEKRPRQVDIRFEDEHNKLSVLVETIDISESDASINEHRVRLMNNYCTLESKIRPDNNIILILAHSGSVEVVETYQKPKENTSPTLLSDCSFVKSMAEYTDYFKVKPVNNELAIKTAVKELNTLLQKNDIPADIRGQFVGSCLLALKDVDFLYRKKSKTTNTIFATTDVLTSIKSVIENLLDERDSQAKDVKIKLLAKRVLENQKVKNVDMYSLDEILEFIDKNINANINPDTTLGQDLLNLFFTTFNKYVGKSDKNQAFTPDHITQFMCEVAGVSKTKRVLDPTCGSGSFLVQALIMELNDCNTDAERDEVKLHNIFGIEAEEKAFGLSTTNMLIHGDGNSNVVFNAKYGCFKLYDWIRSNNIDLVLMNPPYNAPPKTILQVVKGYTVHNWEPKKINGKEDPTKGFCFVNYIAECVGKDKDGKSRSARLLCLLPLACAIGGSKEIKQAKKDILVNNTLEAVFTLPEQVFFPGSNAETCCMVFQLGQPHFTKVNGKEVPRDSTFFGHFKDDGHVTKKNFGRVGKLDKDGNPLWPTIKQQWLNLYKGREINNSLAVRKKVTAEDEWLAEAYIETDYSNLSDKDFEKSIRDFVAYKMATGVDVTKETEDYGDSEDDNSK